MKLMGVGVRSVLGAALLAGCAEWTLVAEPTVSPPDPTAMLEAKLTRLATRLDVIEQSLVAERDTRQARVAVSEQAIVALKRELKEAKAAMAVLRRKIEAPPVPETRREVAIISRDAPSLAHSQVDVALGELPGGNGERVTRPIPAVIPDAAQEILVYVQVATGYVKGGPHRFRIATRLDGNQEAAFYLYAVGQPQQGWAYNSDNVWLPMPKNRELILQADGELFFGDWSSEVRIVGYR